VPADDVVLDLAELGLADPPAISADVTLQAGLLRSRHYHRTRCAVSLADCVVVATALAHSASAATSDPHLLDVCHAEGVPVVVLPDTAGQRWRSP